MRALRIKKFYFGALVSLKERSRMKQASFIYGIVAVIATSLFISPPSFAKTVKACEEEWKANKPAIQASGKTKKDFIAGCRAETASAEPTSEAAKPAPTSSAEAQAPAAQPRTSSAKTVRACAAEWTANKAALEASGKTRKDFIAECRAGTETTAEAAPSGERTPDAAPAQARKTVKACEAEWRANKASIQAAGKRKTDFMTECRAEPDSTQTAAPQPAPAAQPKSEVAAAPQSAPREPDRQATAAPQAPSAPAAQPKSEAEAAPQSAPREQPNRRANQAPAATVSLAAGQFTSESEAKSHCPGDTVVWANTRSKIYHYASSHRYGHTKNGAYMCEKETAAAGIRAAKRERRL